MVCKCDKKGEKEIELTEEQERILRAMAGMECPVASRDISKATGIPSKSLSCRIRSLKTKGFLHSPARCRYELTDAGRQFAGS